MLIIKVDPPFLYSSMKKNHKDSADFWHRKITLKIRIVPYLTFNTKSNQIPRTFLRPFSYTLGLTYPTLNSATLSYSSEVTLTTIYFDLDSTVKLGFKELFGHHKKVFLLTQCYRRFWVKWRKCKNVQRG